VKGRLLNFFLLFVFMEKPKTIILRDESWYKRMIILSTVLTSVVYIGAGIGFLYVTGFPRKNDFCQIYDQTIIRALKDKEELDQEINNNPVFDYEGVKYIVSHTREELTRLESLRRYKRMMCSQKDNLEIVIDSNEQTLRTFERLERTSSENPTTE